MTEQIHTHFEPIAASPMPQHMPEDYWQMGSGPEQKTAAQDPEQIFQDYMAMRGAYAGDRGPDGSYPSLDRIIERMNEFPKKMPDIYAAYRLDEIGRAVRAQLNDQSDGHAPLTWTGARAGEGLRLVGDPERRTLSVEHPSMQLRWGLGDLSQGRPRGDRVIITFGKPDEGSSDERPVATCTFVSRSNPDDILTQPMPTERLIGLLQTGMFERPLTRAQRVGRMVMDASPIQRLNYRRNKESLRYAKP